MHQNVQDRVLNKLIIYILAFLHLVMLEQPPTVSGFLLDRHPLGAANECFINNDYFSHVTSSSEVENVGSVLHSQSFLDRQPRKRVSLGPDHQVKIPVCCSQFQTAYAGSNTDKYMGTCVIPMLGIGSKVPCDIVVRKEEDISRFSFYDRRSLKTIIGHLIADSRETIRKDKGHQKFKELGFLEMVRR